jgi:hypothetical protein
MRQGALPSRKHRKMSENKGVAAEKESLRKPDFAKLNGAVHKNRLLGSHWLKRCAAPRTMANQHHIAPAIMNDQRELFEVFIIGEQTVRTFKRIFMFAAIHFQRCLHRLTA